jgi:hypothetical protein
MAAYPPEYDNPCVCEVCGKDVEEEPGCICLECQTCHEHGNPRCVCDGGEGCEEVTP